MLDQDRASQIRDLLRQLSGVEDVDVDEGPEGEIVSIEIRVADAAAAQRVTRNVESALMTGLGISLEHQRIKVIQNGRGPSGNGLDPTQLTELPAQSLLEEEAVERPPAREPDKKAAAEPRESRRVRLVGVRCVPDGEIYVEVTVDLQVGGEFHRGRVREADTPKTRMLAAARATVGALAGALEPGTAIALEGLEEFRVADAKGVLAILRARMGHARPVYHGAATVERDPVDAAARAVLDALNRFWEARGEAG